MANNTPSYASSALPKISLKSITPELFADTAEEAARCCNNSDCNKRAQLRRFYDELVMWHEKVFSKQTAEEQEKCFRELLPFIQMMRAKAAYAQGRKLIDQNFRDLFNNLICEIKSPQTLHAAKIFFEAFLGFQRYFES